MDILNWLHIKKQQLIRTTLDSPKDLVVLGADVSFQKRGDKYQSYAMPAEDFLAMVPAPTPAYKVYTALLTQSGVDDSLAIDSGLLTIGVTYMINNPSVESDFTNVGAPNNLSGTYFVATGITPNNWGIDTGILVYNPGAPVVTVLENTIGNVWFTYDGVGNYTLWSSSLFTNGKSIIFISTNTADPYTAEEIVKTKLYDTDSMNILSFAAGTVTTFQLSDGVLFNTPIEIRVYN